MKNFQIYVNPHCHDCDSLIEVMQTIVKNRGLPEAGIVNVLDDMDTAVALRITRVPALVYADKVIAQGAVSEAHLEKILNQCLETNEIDHD